jgi:23S rRNA-/tRNA-specific pseudouridylate synthase
VDDVAEPGCLVPILHSDDEIVAVDKPAGLPVIPSPQADAHYCLRSVVERQIGAPVWVVHRLDQDASGVVLFAMTADVHRRLCLAFEHRLVEKTYQALTAGTPDPPVGSIAIALHAARRGKTRPAEPDEPGRRDALTEYETEQVWRRGDATIALVQARPRTGRHHQLRVHFRAVGTPLLFDALYGKRTDLTALADAPCRRLALHARRLILPATVLGARRVLDAPLAADFDATVGWLNREWLGA